MVNELQSQNWDYLLDPAFQLVNSKGSPLTGGHLEVFYNGTRTPYYCASDFNGTLHPFKIPLDSLGSNVVLADPKFSYDVYVYNRFGVLQMSRYNVHPGSGSGSGTSSESGDAAHWIGKSGATVSVPKNIATTLPLPESPDYEGDFATILNNTLVLAPGLYMVDCLVDFRESSSDLTNRMGSIKFYTSDSSDPIEGQIFERNETGPDASGDSHQVQVSFVRHVADVDDDDALRFEIGSSNDLTYAKIDRLSIVKLEQGGGGMTYAPGYGIQIDGQVISTSGMMPESSAANFVNVETYNTDIQNIYETIAETSAMIPSGVATEQYVQDYTSAFITSADLPDMSDYATQQWVEDYVASATTDFITSEDLDGYATQDWVVEQGYITSADLPQSVPLVAGEGISIVDTSASTIISIDSAYSPGVSEEWVEEYVSDYTSAFITSADIPDIPQDVVTSAELATVSGEIVNQIPDVSDMATQTWVNEQGFLTSIPEDLVTSGELATVSGNIMSQIPSQTTVSIDPTLSSGTKIAEFNINGTSGELFAPEGGGSSWSEEYVDIPLYAHSTTTTTWQTIADYASAHGGMAPVGFCEGDGQVYYPTLFQPEYKRVRYVSIYKNPNDPSTTWRFSSKTLEQPFSTSYWKEFYGSYIGQSDWNESDIGKFSYIQNKPDLSDMATRKWVEDRRYLDRVWTDTSLTGDGTAGDPLRLTHPIPSSTSANNDQVLTVVNGYPAWADAQGGGSVTFPLEVSGSTNVYEARDGLTSGYVNAGEIYVGYHDDGGGGEPDLDSVKLTPSMVEVKGFWGGSYPNITNMTPQGLEILDDQGRGHYVDGISIDYWNNAAYALYSSATNWNNTYNAVDTSADYWNSAYDAINDSASNWNDAAGMNEYPISAGPGMSIEDVSGVTVFSTDEITAGTGIKVTTPAAGQIQISNDETVLYDGSSAGQLKSDTTIAISESYLNFEKIKFYFLASAGSVGNTQYTREAIVLRGTGSLSYTEVSTGPIVSGVNGTTHTDVASFTFSTSDETHCTVKSTGIRVSVTSAGAYNTISDRGPTVLRIVGINRISGGN